MDEWRGFITKVLYCTQFSARLDAGEAARVGRLIADGLLGDDPPAHRTRMLNDALRSPEPITDGDWQPHGEREARDFLVALLVELGDGSAP
ncbi:hypothetical protein ACFT9I_39945 [Streptomyces sp. NPDC057137]|uniref:hypothetical protein n=1 Tax=Streptomyces sp. NPDC057137 TaxID=3346030 RepID=UPI00363EA13A